MTDNTIFVSAHSEYAPLIAQDVLNILNYRSWGDYVSPRIFFDEKDATPYIYGVAVLSPREYEASREMLWKYQPLKEWLAQYYIHSIAAE